VTTSAYLKHSNTGRSLWVQSETEPWMRSERLQPRLVEGASRTVCEQTAPERLGLGPTPGLRLRDYWPVRSNQPTHGSIDLELSTTPAERDVQVLSDGLERFNRMIPVGADRTKIPIAVWMRRDGQVLGGACGDTHYGWLYLSLLWVDEALRGQGWGRRLVENFEAAAVERGCHGAWVDTYGFQAPIFYEGLGYREFGRLEEFPPGSARLFYWKHLRPSGEVAANAHVD
jgi:ribosomal protein S18 acetylase RimI-like enzyme